MTADLSVAVGKVALRNPVLTASGTFGYGIEYRDLADVSQLGGICTKGLSPKPRAGNAPPRIVETPAGMLNAIGLSNVGVDAFVAEKLPVLRDLGALVVANVFGETEEEYLAVCRRLSASDAHGVAALELNLSCPNTEAGGLEFGVDAHRASALVARCRSTTTLPLWVKLSPEAADLAGVSRACEAAGADALTVMNTIRGMAIDVHTRRAVLSRGAGGLSGPAIKPLAVRLVRDVSRAVKIPVVGIGGISTWKDVVEFVLAGATAIQVGTACFVDPLAPWKCIEGLQRFCDEQKTNARDLVGAMLEG